MIENGIDGLSCADFGNGVMTGDSMLDHLPLGLSVLQRNTESYHLLTDWLPSDEALTWLKAEDWYMEQFEKDGTFIWMPPPCPSDQTLEHSHLSYSRS